MTNNRGLHHDEEGPPTPGQTDDNEGELPTMTGGGWIQQRGENTSYIPAFIYQNHGPRSTYSSY